MRKLFLFLSLLLLTACSIFQKNDFTENSLRLLPPEQATESYVVKQKVTIEKSDEQHQFIAALRLEKNKVQMVGLLPTGQILFSLSYNGKTLEESNAAVEIPTEEIFSIMQFALWPQVALDEHYPSSKGWSVAVTDSERLLSRNFSGMLLKIVYEGKMGDLTVYNYLHGKDLQFKIIIQTLEKSLL